MISHTKINKQKIKGLSTTKRFISGANSQVEVNFIFTLFYNFLWSVIIWHCNRTGPSVSDFDWEIVVIASGWSFNSHLILTSLVFYFIL